MTPPALLDRVVVRVDGCWSWNGAHRAHDNRPVANRRIVYRQMWELLIGSPVTGKHLHHRCGNRWCVNVGHLEPLTAREHIAQHPEIVQAGADINRRKTHCPSGHEYTPENTRLYHGKRHCKACDYARPPRGRGGSSC